MELQREANFLEAPHPTLYPAVWDADEQIRPEAKVAFIQTFLAVTEPVWPDIRQWVRFAIIGSGASYNWDETGDIDVQVWVSDSTKIHDVRHLVASTLMDKTCASLGLATSDCSGAMAVQWYAKSGRGTAKENLAGQPYACYDLDANRWLVHPFPLTPEYYGDLFSLVLPRAEEVAAEAGPLLADYDRAVKDREFWASLAAETSGRYADRVRVAEANLVKAHAAVKALFLTVAKGRTDAYSPGGQGIHDERDALVKVLEVWGVFDRLKHIGQGRPGVVGALHREAVKVEPGSGKVYFAEVDCSRVTSTRVVVCFTPMKAEGDLWVMLPVGLLTWDRGTHEVEMVYVPEDYRRRGIGRELWEYAKTKEPGLQHSSDRTNDGDAWARSVGGEVPERKGRGGDMRNASMLTLHLMGYGPQDVIGEVEQR